MMARRKTPEEKTATRRAQAERYLARKEAAGLRQVRVWAPAVALEDGRVAGVVVEDGNGGFRVVWSDPTLESLPFTLS